MKNRDKKPITEKILERLEDKTKFSLEISKARALLGIPPHKGFGSDEDYLDWFMNDTQGDCIINMNATILNLTELAIDLLKKDKIDIKPEGFWNTIAEYLLFGKKEIIIFGKKRKPFKIRYGYIDVKRIKDINNDYIKFLQTTNPKGVSINIYPETTKEELSRFIEKEYQGIKTLLGNPKSLHIRDYSNKERDKKIYKIWETYSKKTIGELRKIAGKWSCFDKSDAISIILEKDYGIQIKSDNLRTVVSRIKKRKG